jgi:hypothetical protein
LSSCGFEEKVELNVGCAESACAAFRKKMLMTGGKQPLECLKLLCVSRMGDETHISLDLPRKKSFVRKFFDDVSHFSSEHSPPPPSCMSVVKFFTAGEAQTWVFHFISFHFHRRFYYHAEYFMS